MNHQETVAQFLTTLIVGLTCAIVHWSLFGGEPGVLGFAYGLFFNTVWLIGHIANQKEK